METGWSVGSQTLRLYTPQMYRHKHTTVNDRVEVSAAILLGTSTQHKRRKKRRLRAPCPQHKQCKRTAVRGRGERKIQRKRRQEDLEEEEEDDEETRWRRGKWEVMPRRKMRQEEQEWEDEWEDEQERRGQRITSPLWHTQTNYFKIDVVVLSSPP